MARLYIVTPRNTTQNVRLKGHPVAKKATACFIEPMFLMRTEKLPEGADWVVELKLDGYKALAVKNGGKVHRRSRNDNDFQPIPDARGGFTRLREGAV